MTSAKVTLIEIVWRVKIRYILLLLGVIIVSGCGERAVPPAPLNFVPKTVQPAAPSPTQAESAVEATVSNEAMAGEHPLAARVDDQPIFLETYEKQVAQMVQTLQAQAVDLSGEAGQETLAQVRRQVLEALIDQEIIELEAQKLGITVSEEALEARAQESIAQGEGEVQFAEWLAANNLSYEEFKSTLRSELIANQLFEQVTSNTPKTAEQIRLSYIRVTDPATAQTIIEQLKSGGDFAALAQQYSLDESSRANGGEVGWFARGLGPIPPEVEAIAFSLQPGQVSGPIQVALGFHIIKLEEKEAQRPLTDEMQQVMKQRIFQEWLVSRRTAVVIKRFVGL